MTHNAKLVAAPKMRERSGDVCAMTEYRWRKVGILPEPIKINGRNYYYESDVLAIPQRAAEVEARKAAEKAADDAQ